MERAFHFPDEVQDSLTFGIFLACLAMETLSSGKVKTVSTLSQIISIMQYLAKKKKALLQY